MDKRFKQIATSLVIFWLFIAVLIYYKIQIEHLNFKRVKDSFVADKYTFGSFKIGDVTVPILLNTNTGESWRYFQDIDKKTHGWSPITFYENRESK